jgi:hypothetical protein
MCRLPLAVRMLRWGVVTLVPDLFNRMQVGGVVHPFE